MRQVRAAARARARDLLIRTEALSPMGARCAQLCRRNAPTPLNATACAASVHGFLIRTESHVAVCAERCRVCRLLQASTMCCVAQRPPPCAPPAGTDHAVCLAVATNIFRSRPPHCSRLAGRDRCWCECHPVSKEHVRQALAVVSRQHPPARPSRASLRQVFLFFQKPWIALHSSGPSL